MNGTSFDEIRQEILYLELPFTSFVVMLGLLKQDGSWESKARESIGSFITSTGASISSRWASHASYSYHKKR